MTCTRCERPVDDNAIQCPKCGELIAHFFFQPIQQEIVDRFHALGEDVATKLGFGGSRGSSKSRLGRDLALLAAFENPGVLIYIVMRNYGDLDDIWIKKYEQERPQLMNYFRSSPHPEFNFPKELGGSTIAFRYADTHDQITKLERGPEAFLIIVDQAEQFAGIELVQINTPNRWPQVKAGACKTVYLFNPGGRGTEWLKRVFYLRQFEGTERPSDFAFTQSYGWLNWYWFTAVPGLTYEEFNKLPGEIPPCPDRKYDNAWLASVPDNYRFKIFVTQTSEGRKMWEKPEAIRMGDLFGRFDKFAGQYFAGVWDERLCVLSSEHVDRLAKSWWVCWVGGDRGFGHNSAVYWACIGKLSPTEAWEQLQIDTEWPIDIVIFYRELVTEERTGETELGQAIVKATPEPERTHLRKFVMGSDVNMKPRFATHSIKEMIEAQTSPAGFPRITNAQDGPGSRAVNARLLYEMLRRTCSMRSENPPKDKPTEKTPPLMFVSAECPELIKAIPSMMTDPDSPDDFLKIEETADDVIDGAKYTAAEYAAVQVMAPASVRMAEAMRKADTNTGRYLNMLKFQQQERQRERRPRKRF